METIFSVKIPIGQLRFLSLTIMKLKFDENYSLSPILIYLKGLDLFYAVTVLNLWSNSKKEGLGRSVAFLFGIKA